MSVKSENGLIARPYPPSWLNYLNGWGWMLASGTQLWGPPRQIRFGLAFEFN